MNILILSAGTRNKVVQAFRQELSGKGRVIATDASNLAPALYDADKAYIVPRIDAPDYIDRILEICKAERVNGVLSLIDPELSLLAQNRERFEAIGVTPIVSSYALCEMSLDKYEMYRYARTNYVSVPQCWLDIRTFRAEVLTGRAHFPVFVKPRRGSASIGIQRIDTMETLEVLFQEAYRTGEELLIQEYMSGQEYGLDMYLDLITGKCTALFLKKKIKMRAGETDKAISALDPDVFEAAIRLAEHAGYRGMIDMDLFHDEGENKSDDSNVPKGRWYLSEINPRFGGGYPHAYACGVNFPHMILENLEGRETPNTVGQYQAGIAMMKYNEICIQDESKLVPADQ